MPIGINTISGMFLLCPDHIDIIGVSRTWSRLTPYVLIMVNAILRPWFS